MELYKKTTKISKLSGENESKTETPPHAITSLSMKLLSPDLQIR